MTATPTNSSSKPNTSPIIGVETSFISELSAIALANFCDNYGVKPGNYAQVKFSTICGYVSKDSMKCKDLLSLFDATQIFDHNDKPLFFVCHPLKSQWTAESTYSLGLFLKANDLGYKLVTSWVDPLNRDAMLIYRPERYSAAINK